MTGLPRFLMHWTKPSITFIKMISFKVLHIKGLKVPCASISGFILQTWQWSGLIQCWSSALALGASVVGHHSLLLMNSFNKTEAAVFLCRLCFLRAFTFISFIVPFHHRVCNITTVSCIFTLFLGSWADLGRTSNKYHVVKLWTTSRCLCKSQL